jgi:hypothetical protein
MLDAIATTSSATRASWAFRSEKARGRRIVTP